MTYYVATIPEAPIGKIGICQLGGKSEYVFIAHHANRNVKTAVVLSSKIVRTFSMPDSILIIDDARIAPIVNIDTVRTGFLGESGVIQFSSNSTELIAYFTETSSIEIDLSTGLVGGVHNSYGTYTANWQIVRPRPNAPDEILYTRTPPSDGSVV